MSAPRLCKHYNTSPFSSRFIIPPVIYVASPRRDVVRIHGYKSIFYCFGEGWRAPLRSPNRDLDDSHTFSPRRVSEGTDVLLKRGKTQLPTLSFFVHAAAYLQPVSINFSGSSQSPGEICPSWAVNHSEAIISIASHPFLFPADRP